MSLLDCICCSRHSFRTAAVWDDLLTHCSCHFTYCELTSRVLAIAKLLSNYFKDAQYPFSPVAVVGQMCPDILSGILGVLSLPLYIFNGGTRDGGVFGGVAFLPLHSNAGAEEFCKLQENDVEIILVELSAFQSFTNGYTKLATCRLVAVDTTLLCTFGLVLIHISWPNEMGVSRKARAVAKARALALSQSAMEEYIRDCGNMDCYACSCQGLADNGGSWFDRRKLCDQLQEGCPLEECHQLEKGLQLEEGYQLKGEQNHLNSQSELEMGVKNHTNNNNTQTETSLFREGKLGKLHSVFFSQLKSSNIDRRNCPLLPPSEVVYVLSTSGTTGRPVSVSVPHCSILPNILDLRSRFGLGPDDVIFNASPLTFDPSVVEIFLALSCGCSLIMAPDSIKRSPADLAALLFRKHYVSMLQITPSLLFRFPVGVVKDRLLGCDSHVCVLALGGEQCPSYDQLIKWKHSENKTRVFNLYGITEVSSWSTCHEITFSHLPSSPPNNPHHNLTPLGNTLLGTSLELRHPDAPSSAEVGGAGLIWVGGQYRACSVEGEVTPPADGMRCTGDWGIIGDDGRVYCQGRNDRQVKRHGQRINLDYVQQRISALLHRPCYLYAVIPGNDTCQDNFRIVDSTKKDFPAATNSKDHPGGSRASNVEIIGYVVMDCDELAGETEEDDGSECFVGRIRGSLPSSWIPDKFVAIEHIPITTHGKVDTKALLAHLTKNIEISPESSTEEATKISKEEIMSFLTSNITSLTDQTPPIGHTPLAESTRLTNIGLDSFDIVRLSNQITEYLEKAKHPTSSLEDLLEQLQDKPLGDVVQYLVDKVNKSSGVHSWERPTSQVVGGAKRIKIDIGRDGNSSDVMSCDSHVTGAGVVEWWRRGQHYVNGRQQNIEINVSASSSVSRPTLAASCSIAWKIDTYKCIDASPLVVLSKRSDCSHGNECSHVNNCSHGNNDRTAPEATVRGRVESREDVMVYVGSHSHLFVGVELATGREVWRTELPDRVESTACMSLCGGFVVVGCYDGCLHVLKACCGQVHWVFVPPPPPTTTTTAAATTTTTITTRELRPIKSSPCLDESTGWVWFGSHDEHLYAVDILERCLVHRLYPGGGSIFSTPHLDQTHRSVYVATLRGAVFSYHMDTGAVLWSLSLGKPIFSSLAMTPDKELLLVGLVDGSLHSIDGHTGEVHSKVCTTQSIFSSCCCCCVVNSDNAARKSNHTLIICGSHDKHIYCWNQDLELEWKSFLGSEVYSIPFCHRVSDGGVEVWCVTVATVQGVLFTLEVTSGDVTCQIQLPGQIFSSPVAIGNKLVIGCRDNHMYCIDICLEHNHNQ